MSKGVLLVVDDDPSICTVLQHIGESCGYRVSTTLSAETFREQYHLVDPDLITLDLNIDQSDGIELLRWLSAAHCKAKIILISGFDEKIIHSAMLLGRSQQLNIIATLHKPVDISGLKSIFEYSHENDVTIDSTRLLAAIEKQEFVLFYQPKISIATGKLLAVEALIRWKMHDCKMIFPDEFIPMAEENGLIEPLSNWVNVQAIQQCAEFQRKGFDLMMSINISAVQLVNLELPDELYRIAKANALSPEKICIEITESAAMGAPALTLDVLTRFRIKGFLVSIDDFGTGYSSLIELQRMPCSEIKIDKSFVMSISRGTPEYIIARSIINLGHDFGLTVVAEGVETAAALEILKELGCDIAQGYYIGHPMPIEEFYLWLDMHVDAKMMFTFPGEK